MPLMAVSLLASCNNGGGDKPEEVKFSLSSDHPIEVVDKTAIVYVDWTPTDTIKFESFTFTASPAKENTVTFEQTGDPRPMPVKITFNDDITSDISGTLSFAYEDVTAKTTGNSSIDVTIIAPESPSMLPVKCSMYVPFEGETYLMSVEQYEYNDKGLVIKKTIQYTSEDVEEIDDYEYNDKNNVTKDTYTYISEGEIKDTDEITYTYIYDGENRITKKTEHKENRTSDYIDEYTYEADMTAWKTYKYSANGGTSYAKDITRTFEDGLYIKSVDSIKNEYYYYIWDEYKCNTKIETYSGEEKTPANHKSDETCEYHKNRPDQLSKYVLSYYEQGEIESTETILTEYDGYDRKTKITTYEEEDLDIFMVYEYAN